MAELFYALMVTVLGIIAVSSVAYVVYSIDEKSQQKTATLPNGGEIHFTDYTRGRVADVIDVKPGGWILAIYKKEYQQELYPPHRVRGVYTHTTDEQEQEWVDNG